MRAVWTDRLPQAYFVACWLVMLAVFLPADSSYSWFWLLFFLTLPMSLVGYFVNLYGGLILFGPGELGFADRVFVLVVWTTVIAIQARALCEICRARQRRGHASA